MKLIDYLRERRETVSDFAKRAEVSGNTIRKIVYGQRQPSLGLAAKLSGLTDGRVSVEDMIIDDSSRAAA